MHRRLSLALVLALIGCNDAPQAGVLAITPESPTTTDELVATFEEPVVDKNDDELTWSWTWRRNQLVVEDLTSDRVPADRTTRDDVWVVEVVAMDKREMSEVMTASVTIANTPPTLTLSGLPETATTVEALEVQVDASDADEDTIEVSYAWSVDGSVTSYDSAVLPADATAKGQVWEVEVTVADPDGPGASERLATTIVNTPPAIDAARVAPEVIFEDTVVTCVLEGWVDMDGDAEGANITWLVNDTEVATGPELTGASFDKGDTVACRAEPDDGEVVGESALSGAVTVSNSPPTLASATASPDPVRTKDEVSVVLGELVDIDGDAITLAFGWTVNGSAAGSDPTLPAASHVRGDIIGLTLVPNDGEEDGPAVVMDEVTVANTPPVVLSGAITPSVAYTNDVLGVEVELYDADDDEVTVAASWSVDGSVVASGLSLDGATWFDKNEVVVAELTPDDGLDTGVALTTASVTVSNSPPTEPVVVIDPFYPTEGEGLDCLIDTDSIDADGDSITYTGRWTVDGSASTSATTTDFTNDTIPSEVTVDGEEWTCFVTASDGTDTSAEVSDTVDVSDWPGLVTFTPCGATGQDGPTQAACNTAYTGTTLEGLVTVSGGKQQLTIPKDGTYRIEVWGAQGESAESGRSGGRGARMRGDFTLWEGDVLTIIVGQRGVQNSCNGGGGGASAVHRGGAPYVVAGGGGGTRAAVDQNGCDASTAQQAGTGSGHSSTHGCGLKATSTIGNGGIVSSSSWGSGGASIVSNGTGEYDTLNGGRAIITGTAVGGGTSTYLAYGGFGGGGAGNGGCGGGGGGGYSGGDGGRLAGAGGSYNGGSSQSNSAGVRSGDGLVTIDLL